MSLTYNISDRDGRVITEVPLVLAPVALTGVETTLTSNIVTVASTTGLYPGMPVAIPNIPAGAFIHAVKDSTTIELLRSVYSSGAWTTVAANANATAADTGLSGHAYGYHFACIIEQAYAMGMWRNLHNARAIGISQTTSTNREVQANELFGKGVAIVPSGGTWSAQVFAPTASGSVIATSDELAASPAKRHNGEIWGVRPFVQTSGALSHVSARPDWSVVLSEIV
jgi:hypothetical protein